MVGPDNFSLCRHAVTRKAVRTALVSWSRRPSTRHSVLLILQAPLITKPVRVHLQRPPCSGRRSGSHRNNVHFPVRDNHGPSLGDSHPSFTDGLNFSERLSTSQIRH